MRPLFSTATFSRRHCLLATAVAVTAILPWAVTDAQALSSSTPMGEVLCAAIGWLTGNLGKGLATLFIIVLGVTALFGRLSWGVAVMTAVGIAALFGASSLLSAMDSAAASVSCTPATPPPPPPSS